MRDRIYRWRVKRAFRRWLRTNPRAAAERMAAAELTRQQMLDGKWLKP